MGINKTAALNGLWVETGTTSTGTSVNVKTRLSKVLFSSFVHTEAPTAAPTMYSNNTVASSQIVVHDATGGTKTVSYILIGYP
jgi:hypothetical protein